MLAAIRKVDAVAPRPRLAVELRARADVEADVGDRDDRVPAALPIGFGPDRVVVVARVLWVDCDDGQVREVLSLSSSPGRGGGRPTA